MVRYCLRGHVPEEILGRARCCGHGYEEGPACEEAASGGDWGS